MGIRNPFRKQDAPAPKEVLGTKDTENAPVDHKSDSQGKAAEDGGIVQGTGEGHTISGVSFL